MLDLIVVLLILYAMAFYYYGSRVAILGSAGIVTSVLADALCSKIVGRKPNPRDLSSVATGMLIPLMLPASAPLYLPMIAAVVAIIIAKHPFGGVGHNVFNPAAVGFSFVAISFTAQVFSYPAPLSEIITDGLRVLHYVPDTSSAFTLGLGAIPRFQLVDMALGNHPGPMGATNILVIFACLLYLIFKGTIRWHIPVSFFISVSLFTYLFPRMPAPRHMSVAYELMSGMLFFGGVFLLGDPVTTPKRNLSRIVFGAVCGIVVMLFRNFSLIEEPFAFAILIMNASAWGMDMFAERFYKIARRKRVEAFAGKKTQKKA